MTKNTTRFVRGVGTGIAAGVVVTTMGAVMLKNKKSLSKNARKAVNTMGDIVDSVSGMFK